MESTRKHWWIAVAALGMASATQAEEKANSEVTTRQVPSAAANAALNLADLEQAEAPSVPAVTTSDASEGTPPEPATAPVANSEQSNAADEATLYPAPAAETADAQPAASAPRRLIPRGAASQADAEVDPAAAQDGIALSRPATALPWYRRPYVALGGVLALIAALTVLARKYMPATRPIQNDVLRVVGRVPIAAKQSAVLLHVGQRLVLVGMGPDALRTLAEITDPQEVALLLGRSATAPKDAFDTMLAEELNAYQEPGDEPEAPPQVVRETLQATRGQLESLRSRIRAMQNA